VKQFLLPGRYAGEKQFSLTGRDYRYLVKVLRLAPGAELAARDARGVSYTLRILGIGETTCDVELLRGADDPSPDESSHLAGAAARIILLQCLPKGRKIDLIVRQATEAGVSRIVPLSSEHSLVRPGDRDGRGERLRRIAREAVQQSGTPLMPIIDEPRSIGSLVDAGEDWGMALVFHEQPVDGKPLHELLAERPATVSVLIGPEGGLSTLEVALLTGAGFKAVHFNTGVLRVETAATYALGAVITILQERNAWRPAQTE
jgi:16S rRNA (uracil1498-N3)-methyltransferase